MNNYNLVMFKIFVIIIMFWLWWQMMKIVAIGLH